MRITNVYTKTGDGGDTGVCGGARIAKDAARIAAIGDVDELNSAVGVVLASGPDEETAAILRRIQNQLFRVGSDLSFPAPATERANAPLVEAVHVEALETDIDQVQKQLRPLEEFVLPGGSESAARLFLARAICRRAERSIVRLARAEEIGAQIVPYLNRLSDLLFVLARRENVATGGDEPQWDPAI